MDSEVTLCWQIGALSEEEINQCWNRPDCMCVSQCRELLAERSGRDWQGDEEGSPTFE